MAYTVEIDTKAAREIRRLPKQEQRRVIANA
jgi:mRNA-degrading endonuclease RelE of RelBE toxin-antitoxin system